MPNCPYCAEEIQRGLSVCPYCDSNLREGGRRQSPQKEMGEDFGMRMLLPVGRSGWAIAAGYAGLFSILCFPAPIAIILGAIAIYDIKKHPKRHGMGRAVFGLVMGIIGTIVLIFGIINAMNR